MSTAHEIADFIRLTRGLSPWTLARAIRHRWPRAGEAEIREAMRVASEFAEGLAPRPDVSGVRIVAPLI